MFYEVIDWWVRACLYEAMLPHQDDPEIRDWLWNYSRYVVFTDKLSRGRDGQEDRKTNRT